MNTTNYIQFDLADIIRLKSLKCGDPLIKLGSVQTNEGFEILGSNRLGEAGIPLLCFVNNGTTNTFTIPIPSFESDNVNLIKYGMVPYRYISVRALAGDIVVNDIIFPFCTC
jgi:hypothetical protein